MRHHTLAAAGGADRPRHHVAPHGEIVAGVADHRRLAGRAGGRVNARQLILRHGEKTERVVGSEVRLRGEGKASEILESAEIVRVNAVLIKLGPHRRDHVIDAPKRDAEPARLQSGDLVARSRLDRIEQAFVRRRPKPHRSDLMRQERADGLCAVSTARRSFDAGISPPYRAPVDPASPHLTDRAANRQAGRCAPVGSSAQPTPWRKLVIARESLGASH